jgi:hypothetical protein
MHAQIYYYILRWDDGYAPCPQDGMLTLAICKPAIRKNAKKADWIIGISPKNDGHKLCYVAKVTRNIPGESYYMQDRFRRRGDCIYDFDGRKFTLRPDREVHHGADKKRDVGRSPYYDKAHVLVSSRRSFWYYGKKARNISARKYPALRQRLTRLQQGHRVNHSPPVHEELLALIKERTTGHPGVYGKPRNPPNQTAHDSKCSKHHGVC